MAKSEPKINWHHCPGHDVVYGVVCGQGHVESGGDLSDAHAVDVASLLKQFFRELPDPLLTSALYDVFVQCVGAATVDGTSAPIDAVLLACLLLPDSNLATLRYLVTFLMRVAAMSDRNKMDASNIAVCLAPNLLYCEHTSALPMTDSLRLEAETTVIQLLIENAAYVGMVSDSIFERASLLSMCFTLSGESITSRTTRVTECGKVITQKKKKRRRSGSLQGIIPILHIQILIMHRPACFRDLHALTLYLHKIPFISLQIYFEIKLSKKHLHIGNKLSKAIVNNIVDALMFVNTGRLTNHSTP